MGFLEWFKRDKKITDYTPEELRREEGRLQIRENQAIARVEKLEREREVIFRQGSEVKSSVRRRILARKYEEKEQEIRRMERELGRLSKEAMTVSAIRFRLERREQGESSILKKIGGGEVEALRLLFEDDGVAEDVYSEKLREVLGEVSEGLGDPLETVGRDGRAVLDIWDRMDEGEIEGMDAGMREARDRSEDAERGEAE